MNVNLLEVPREDMDTARGAYREKLVNKAAELIDTFRVQHPDRIPVLEHRWNDADMTMEIRVIDGGPK